MLKDITLGQFFPGKSVIHKLDPRMKIIISIAYIVAAFLAKSLIAFAILAFSAILLIVISRISVITVLKGLKPIVFILLLTMIINLFFTKGEGEPLFQLWKIKIYTSGIYRALLSSLRAIVIIIGTSIFLTYTTSPIALTDAIESLLSPLRFIKVPVHDFAMIITIALRFIPTITEETERIMNAQKARGADFSNGGLIKRAKALIPIIIPLFVSAFSRAGDLAVAMECRCYRGGSGRTKYHKLTLKFSDFIAFILMGCFIAGIVLINKYLTYGFVFSFGT